MDLSQPIESLKAPPVAWRAGLGAAILLVAIICFYPTQKRVTRSAVEEFTLTQKAMASAKSWHSHVLSKKQGGDVLLDTTSDVVCPYDVHYVSLVPPYESATVNGVLYRRQESGEWQIDRPSIVSSTRPVLVECQLGPFSEDIFGNLQAFPTWNTASKGEKKTIDGDSCREWTVTAVAETVPRFTICINSDDHLPREFRTYDRHPAAGLSPAGNVTTVTRWNQVKVDPPM